MTEFKYCPQCRAELVMVEDDGQRPSCPEGHFTHYDNPVPTVLAFVRSPSGTYLTLKRAIEPQKGHWELPGGYLEAGEEPDQAIRREIKEETGLTVTVERIFGAFKSMYGENGRHTVGIGYVCAADTGTVILSNEGSDFQWLSLDQFPTLAFDDENKALAEMRRSQ